MAKKKAAPKSVSKKKRVTAVAVKTTKAKKPAVAKRKTAKQPKGKCFVMMPFEKPFDGYYESIYKPAIRAAGLEPVRADDLFRPSVIVSDLWEMIQDADVLIAELTTKNANVFYELGLAHAIGKAVVLVSETMDDVPFDLRPLRVIPYNKEDPVWGDKLCKNITASVKETLESPVEAVPAIFRKKVKSQAPEQDAISARLEDVERQVRILRTEKPMHSRGEPIYQSITRELRDIGSLSELDEWIARWHRRGVSPDDLQRPIMEYIGLTSQEAKDRIIRTIKKMRK